jgi:hypothetical protein
MATEASSSKPRAAHDARGLGSHASQRSSAKQTSLQSAHVGKGSGLRPAQQTSKDPRLDFSADEWHEMVATAAYYRAEARGFGDGSPEDDWFEAEAQLREQLANAEDEADDKDAASLDLNAHQPTNQSQEK